MILDALPRVDCERDVPRLASPYGRDFQDRHEGTATTSWATTSWGGIPAQEALMPWFHPVHAIYGGFQKRFFLGDLLSKGA